MPLLFIGHTETITQTKKPLDSHWLLQRYRLAFSSFKSPDRVNPLSQGSGEVL